MRTFYELCSKADVCARKGHPEDALGALIEAYAVIRPEVLKAMARFEPRTAFGYLETLRATAERCGGGIGLEHSAWVEPPTNFSRAPRTDGNFSTIKRWRWSERREKTGGTIEHWYDVACRCPSF